MTCLNCFYHQEQFSTPTALSRLDLLNSLTEWGEIQIDRYHENTPDKAFFNGHYYSDKAPGTVAVGLLPFITIKKMLSHAGTSTNDPSTWLPLSWGTSAVILGLPSAIASLMFFTTCLYYTNGRMAFLSTVFVFIGSLSLPYSTMLFSHSLLIALLIIALCMILNQSVERRRLCTFKSVQLGSILGLALACEYTSGIAVVSLLFLAWQSRQFVIGWVVVGFLTLSLFLIMGYNALCFGNPILLPYSLQASFSEMRSGTFGISAPNFQVSQELLIRPTRGLFFFCPILLMSIPGLWVLSKASSNVAATLYLGAVLTIVILSGYVWDWRASPAFSARYLSPVIPLLSLPVALGVSRFPVAGCSIGAISVFICSLVTATSAVHEYGFQNPLVEKNFPKLVEGALNPSIVHLLGVSGSSSILLFYLLLIGGSAAFLRVISRVPVLQK